MSILQQFLQPYNEYKPFLSLNDLGYTSRDYKYVRNQQALFLTPTVETNFCEDNNDNDSNDSEPKVYSKGSFENPIVDLEGLRELKKKKKKKKVQMKAKKIVEGLLKKDNIFSTPKKEKDDENKQQYTSPSKKTPLKDNEYIIDPRKRIESDLIQYISDKKKFKSFDLQVKCLGSERYRSNLINGVNEYNKEKYFGVHSKEVRSNFEELNKRAYQKIYEKNIENKRFSTLTSSRLRFRDNFRKKKIPYELPQITIAKNRLKQDKNIEEKIDYCYDAVMKLNELTKRTDKHLVNIFPGYDKLFC